jgi:uncharacterized Ntn-hydrolase superfamily protein
MPAEIGRPVHTYSIVACDVDSKELGVAVQSHWFNVGPVVVWAEAGVGAVATQSFANVAFGPRGLALLRSGEAPEAAIDTVLEADAGRDLRQVAMVDAAGRVAAHTGVRCIAWADHATGEGWSAQANIMANPGVPAAMGAAFEAKKGRLADRLLAALEAAQKVGGDIRGQQSAAIRVVSTIPAEDGSPGVRVDLRVEDDSEPLRDLRRLYDIHRAYDHMNAGDTAMERGDFDAAMHEYRQASGIQPENLEMRFWAAFTMATHGRISESIPMFRDIFARDSRWPELLERLPASGLCDAELVREIVEGASSRH